MKGLIVLVTCMVTLVMNGQNCFTDGMKWYTESYGTHDPFATPQIEVVSLEKSDENDCFKMFREYQDQVFDKQFVAYIKVDGDKVFYRLPSGDQRDWYLLYDFGLVPSQGCYVYNPLTSSADNKPRATYIKCVGFNTSDYGDLTAMILEEYSDESCIQLLGNGIWLKGLSSLNGVLDNNYFGADGRSSKLIGIYNNDEPIYATNVSSIPEVTNSDTVNLKIDGCCLTVFTDKSVKGSIYSPSGIHIGDLVFDNQASSIQLPGSGIYILNIDGTTKKIYVP
ncbi:MAG: hypothetical protein NC217_07490 [Muribaculaceae bacterium]|nr:hypothetical protein [Muribaculaceae bacterium]